MTLFFFHTSFSVTHSVPPPSPLSPLPFASSWTLLTLVVVPLFRFRGMRAGDTLRSIYEQLSADPNSLANLDQVREEKYMSGRMSMRRIYLPKRKPWVQRVGRTKRWRPTVLFVPSYTGQSVTSDLRSLSLSVSVFVVHPQSHIVTLSFFLSVCLAVSLCHHGYSLIIIFRICLPTLSPQFPFSPFHKNGFVSVRFSFFLSLFLSSFCPFASW